MPRAPHIPPEDKGSSLALWVLILCLVGAALLVALCCPGCAPVRPVAVRPTTQASSLVWSDDIELGAVLWKAEAQRRWPTTPIFVFACHGDDDATGHYRCYPDVGDTLEAVAVARTLSDTHPDSIILWVCCNAHGQSVAVPRGNVFFCRRKVRIIPHTAFGANSADNIWEFVNR